MIHDPLSRKCTPTPIRATACRIRGGKNATLKTASICLCLPRNQSNEMKPNQYRMTKYV